LVVRSSLRRRTRFPSSGWTEILVPAGRMSRLRLARLILSKPARLSPRRALAETLGALRLSLRMTVKAEEPWG